VALEIVPFAATQGVLRPSLTKSAHFQDSASSNPAFPRGWGISGILAISIPHKRNSMLCPQWAPASLEGDWEYKDFVMEVEIGKDFYENCGRKRFVMKEAAHETNAYLPFSNPCHTAECL
jgi:hypothetical protein